MNAVDTNILVYAVDADEPVKGARAMDLLDRLTPDDTILPWQVAVECGAVLVRLASRGRLRRSAEEIVRLYQARFPVILPSAATLERGWRIHREHQVAYWDALLIGACIEAGVQTLYSEDMPSQPSIEGVRIVNPLLGA